MDRTNVHNIKVESL